MYNNALNQTRMNQHFSEPLPVLYRKVIVIMKNIDKVLFIMLVGISVFPIQAAGRVQVKIPTVDEVGAKALPEEIAPIQAPFPMPEFSKPRFADLSVSIAEHGAKEGVLSTKEIQAALDAVSNLGGGMVVVPAGKWLSGRISLKSNVNLHISQGAELRFSGAIEDYLPVVFTRSAGYEVMSTGALIYANGQTNIAISGKGKLIGPPDNSEIRKKSIEYGDLDKTVKANYMTPVETRIYDGKKNGGKIFLPAFISPINCKDVYIEGVTLEKTAFWNIVPEYCDGVIIRGITVNSVGIPMGDGIDLESSRNVLIEYSTLNCGDDCFTLKAGRNEDGIRVNKPTENIVVRYCLAQKGHGGITVGSETAGMIKNLYLHDCVFDGTGTGIRFKTRRPRGGGGDNIVYERVRMILSGTAITADMLGSRTYVGNLADRLPVREVNDLTPMFRNVSVKDIIIESAGQFVSIEGIPESPFSNLRVENADVTCKNLIGISDAVNFTFKNADIRSQSSTINLLGVRGLKFDNVSFNSQVEVIIRDGSNDPKNILTENIRFINCTPERPKGWQETTYKPHEETLIEFQIDRNRMTQTYPGPGNYMYYGLNGRVVGPILIPYKRSILSSSNIVVMKNNACQSNRTILLWP